MHKLLVGILPSEHRRHELRNLRGGSLLGRRSDSVFKLRRGNVRTELRDLGVRELPHWVIFGVFGCERVRELFNGLLSIKHWAIELHGVSWR